MMENKIVNYYHAFFQKLIEGQDITEYQGRLFEYDNGLFKGFFVDNNNVPEKIIVGSMVENKGTFFACFDYKNEFAAPEFIKTVVNPNEPEFSTGEITAAHEGSDIYVGVVRVIPIKLNAAELNQENETALFNTLISNLNQRNYAFPYFYEEYSKNPQIYINNINALYDSVFPPSGASNESPKGPSNH